MRGLFASVVGALTVAALLVGGQADGGGKSKEPKYKISEVMKQGMKGGLCKKVAEGNATAAEKQTLIEMFEALHQSKPPRGNQAQWERRTKALLDAARKAATDESAGPALQKLANCMACHSQHKAKKAKGS